VFDCSLRSRRIALGGRLLCRRSPTRSVSAHSSSARRRAIRGLIARSARRDVRSVAAVFVGSDGTEERCSAISSCRSVARTSRIRRRRGRSQRKNASARSLCIARSARCDVRSIAAVFVGSDGTEECCSAISSCTQLAAGAGARCARALCCEIGGANIEKLTLAARQLIH
jgi:hypothetical protein